MTEKLGRYEILEEIGQGGFAIVHRAYDTELDRPVALKELRSHLLIDAAWVERFRREARAIARLDHPHIVTIYDVAQFGERHFIVMRLVNGPGLDEFISERGPLPWADAVEVISAIADGLGYAHAHGILHRDLKPANILVDPERGPLLTDFGFAKLAGEQSMSVTGDIVGTPHYIAPEVWEGQTATAQADIYALGCIFYELVTGEKLFKGETPPTVMLAHFKPLELPNAWPDEISPDIDRVFKKALARRPADRYASAGDMAVDIRGLAATASSKAVDRSKEVGVEPPQKVKSASLETVNLTTVQAAPPPTGDQSPLVQPVSAPETDHAMAHWQQQAENALAENELDEAEQAVRQRPALAPTSPEVADFQLKSQAGKHLADQPLPPPMRPPASAPTPPQPVVTPLPETAPARLQLRRSGCLRAGVVTGAILGVLLIGIAILCATMGDVFNSTIETVLKNVLPEVKTGETRIEPIDVAVPDGAETVNLKLNTDVGKLIITPGTTESLIAGTVTYNVDQLKPEIIVDGNEVRLEHEAGIGPVLGVIRSDIKNEWNLGLGSVPMELTIDAGPAESDLELGGLALRDLSIFQGAASLELSFAKPNRVEMKTLHFRGFASGAELSGLANANAEQIVFEGGGGDYSLDFSGELQRDVDVTLKGGLGAITLIVPETLAAEVVVDDEAIEVRARDSWQKSEDGYFLPGPNRSPHRLTVEVNLSNGQLELRN